jgi:1,4-alpha-glucan branching enzyme
MKWNMGWMHDSLDYMSLEPIFRHYHHNQLTFGLMYAFSENFMLPFSHDEVVHGKRSLLGRMPGDEWQRFANLRLLYTYMFTYPGTKLLFMGCELADPLEWRHAEQLNWSLAEQPLHRGVQHLVRDLNRLYRQHSPLYRLNFSGAGFEWIDCNDATQSVLAYLRRDGDRFLVIVLNFTPVVREDYCVGVPEKGIYREVFNSDSHYYHGSNVSNGTRITAEAKSWMGRPASLVLTLPPLAGIVLQWEAQRD